MKNNGIISMAIATLCFSLLSVCVKFVKHIPAHELILFRGLISLVISYLHIHQLKINPLGNNKKLLFARGFWGTVALTCFFVAVQEIPLATAATLQYSSPIFTAIFGIFLLKEKVSLPQWICIIIAMLGVICINGIDRQVDTLYFSLAVFSGIFSGLAYVIVRKLKTSDHPAVIIFYFPLIAVPVMAIWSLFDWVTPQGTDWIFIILIGLLTQLGQYLMTISLQKEQASRATSVMFIGTINAFVFSLIFFEEVYTKYNLIGIFIVFIAVFTNILITSKKKIAFEKN